jgi:plasmid maintenance system antidote protein VapI
MGNNELTEEQVRDILKQQAAKTSSKALAVYLGISQPYMSELINGTRSISQTIAHRLGFERQVIYIYKNKI